MFKKNVFFKTRVDWEPKINKIMFVLQNVTKNVTISKTKLWLEIKNQNDLIDLV